MVGAWNANGRSGLRVTVGVLRRIEMQGCKGLTRKAACCGGSGLKTMIWLAVWCSDQRLG